MNTGIRSFLAAALMLPALVGAATVSGTVTVRNSTTPIAGALVIIGSINGGAASADTTTTDAKGSYHFDNVTTGIKAVGVAHDGYRSDTAFVNVIQNNGSYTANIALTATNGGNGQTGAISGTVKDADSKAAIKGAMVVLSHPAGRGGETPIDTVQTDGEGRFFFPVVPQATGYIVVASYAGYSDGSNSNVTVVRGDTTNTSLTLKKLPAPNAAIVGHVTDAATKKVISGASLTLRRRAAGSATWTNVKTTVTGDDGFYEFRGLEAATFTSPYSIVVAKTDYVTATTANLTVNQNAVDTANVALAKVSKGSMTVFVGKDSTGHIHIEGATVVAVLDGQDTTSYTGSTDHNGMVTFASVIAGNYTVTASADGFVSKVETRQVTANDKDSSDVFLARATAQNSKSLAGLVRDVAGKAIAGAEVVFQANNGVSLTVMSSATGDYSFSGIPLNVTAGTVSVTKSGYIDFEGPVTLGGQSSFLNVTLKLNASGIVRAALAPQRLGLVREGRDLAAVFAPAQVSGSLSLFDARGSRLGIWNVPAGAMRASLGSVGSSRAAYLVLRQGALVQNLALPH